MGVTDGGVYNKPVDVGGGNKGGGGGGAGATPTAAVTPNQWGKSRIYLSNLTPSIWQLIQPAQPSPTPTSVTVNTPWPVQPLVTDKIISAEGIYMVSAASATGVSYLKFTVDLTPPTLDVTLINQAHRAYQSEGGAVAAERPRVKKEAKFRIASRDNLSGVKQVEWHVDDGAYKDYSNNTSSQPVISVTQLGDHTLFTRAVDLAGNKSDEVKFDFTVYDDPPPAAPASVSPPPLRPPSGPPATSPPPPPPTWSLGPNPLQVTGSGVATVVNPAGAQPITITAFVAAPATRFSIYTRESTCKLGARLEPGKSCTIVVAFTYQDRAGSGTLTVSAADGTQRSIVLDGRPLP
jgi:hypothetical protein